MNSLYKELSGMAQQGNNAKRLFDMIKMSKDPNAMLTQLFEQNPQMKYVFDVIQKNGGDPQSAFYAVAKEKGINPEEILSLLR